MTGHYVRSAILAGAVPLISELGGDASSISRAVGLDEQSLYDPDVPVPVRRVFDFFGHAATTCGTRDFGLQMAARANIAVLGPLWILLRQAQTVEQMLRDLVANFDLYTHSVNMSLLPSPGGQLLTWTPGADTGGHETQVAEYSLAVTCNHLRSFAPEGWRPKLVCFRHAKPKDVSAHHRIFGPEVVFDQDFNALFLEDEILKLPATQSRTGRRALVARILRDGGKPWDLGLVDQVDAITRVMLPFAPCDIVAVSDAIGIAPRTLQDHLQKQGTTFKAVKDAARADLALKYLRNSSLSLTEIAAILGYAEISAFSRAFRRWYGQPARNERSGRRSEIAGA